MPRKSKKHWWRCSHDFNLDPEMWELTDLYGDRAIRVALQINSILDKCDNRWEANKAAFEAVFRTCRIYPKTGWKVIWFLFSRKKICVHKQDSSQKILVFGSPNYWKYHTTQYDERSFTWDFLCTQQTIQDRLILYKNKESRSGLRPAPSADPFFSDNGGRESDMDQHLIPELKVQTDRLFNSDREKFRKLIVWVNQGRKYGHTETDMAEALSRFWDYRSVTEWYAYLDTLLEKVEKDRQFAKSEAEHEKHKAEIRDLAEEFRERRAKQKT
jgi:hypothetical protein